MPPELSSDMGVELDVERDRGVRLDAALGRAGRGVVIACTALTAAGDRSLYTILVTTNLPTNWCGPETYAIFCHVSKHFCARRRAMLERLPDDMLVVVSTLLDDPRALCLVSPRVHAVVDPVVLRRTRELSEEYMLAMRLRCRSRAFASRVAYWETPDICCPTYHCGTCRRACLHNVAGDCSVCRSMPAWWGRARYILPPYARSLVVAFTA